MALVITSAANPTIGTATNTDALSITSTGSLIPKKIPMFSAIARDAGWTTSTTPFRMLYNFVTIDNYSGFNTSTNRYTAPISGIYSIGFYFLTGVGSPAFGWTVYKNGALIPGLYADGFEGRIGYQNRTSASSSVTIHVSGNVNVYLNVGDYVDVRQHSQTGGSWYCSSINSFHGHFVSLN